MRNAFLVLVACLLGLLLPACPVLQTPTPGGAGGMVTAGSPQIYGGQGTAGAAEESGGTTASGGASAAAGGAAVAGAAGASEIIAWPVCAPPTQKAKPVDVEAMRRLLGRRHSGPITKRLRSSYAVLDLPSVLWQPLAPTLDQNHPPDGGPGLGSCTGNAGLQGRLSKPWTWGGTLDTAELEQLAIDIYGGATKRDPFEGSYPPDDTGSNGFSVMAEMRDRGLISSWDEVVTFEGLQRALQRGPCIMGSNWYTSMFTPDRCGQLSLSGVVEGGHETKVTGIHYPTKRILFLNSWGTDWGAKLPSGQGGFFWLTFGTVQRLMNEGAEFECPH